MNSRSLLIVGNAKIPGKKRSRLPHDYDEIWTFLSSLPESPDLGVRASRVWDCHPLTPEDLGRKNAMKWPGVESKLFDIRRENKFTKHAIDLFGPRFSSQIAWMLARAIMYGYTHIGLWRILYEASDEWLYQGPDVMYFIGIAREKGITVSVDPDSVLLHPAYYGLQSQMLFRGDV